MKDKYVSLCEAITGVNTTEALNLIEEMHEDELVTSLLHNAIFYKNDKKVCAALLNKMRKEYIHALNNLGNTALHIAASTGDIEICKLLLNEMDPDIANRMNPQGRSALFFAAYDGNLEICKLLLPKMDMEKINTLDSIRSYNPLMYAISEDHIEVIKLLMEHYLKEWTV